MTGAWPSHPPRQEPWRRRQENLQKALEDIKADKPAALSEAEDLDLGEEPAVQHLAILDEEQAKEVGPPTRVGPPTKDPQSDPM